MWAKVISNSDLRLDMAASYAPSNRRPQAVIVSTMVAYLRPRTSLPKLLVAFCLGFVLCLGFDHIVYAKLSGFGRIALLGIISLTISRWIQRPSVVYALGLPVTFMLRKALLASGGVSLIISVGIGLDVVLDVLYSLKHERSRQRLVIPYRPWAAQMTLSLHQSATWFFVSSADAAVMGRFMKLRNEYQASHLWPIAMLFVVYLVSRHLKQPLTKSGYPEPGIYLQLNSLCYGRPLHFRDWMRRLAHRNVTPLVARAFLSRYPLYKYKKLNESESEIRMVKLHAGNSWEIIMASVVSVSVYRSPQFEAISYRWSVGGQVPILLDGQKLLISGRVHEMLLSLKSREEDRLIWIDSICINQVDEAEKSWQVGLMRDIYQSAERVICWLGADPSNQVGPNSLSLLEEITNLHVPDDIGPRSTASSSLQLAFYSAVRIICNDAFFRTWIIQEIALARKLLVKYGEEETSWDDFMKTSDSFLSKYTTLSLNLSELMPANHTQIPHGYGNLNKMNKIKSALQNSKHLCLYELLSSSSAFGVSDPRDRVYGLLGLINTKTSQHPLLEVNYKDTTDTEVSINATKFTLIEENSFRLLEATGIGYESDAITRPVDRPSWVPMWLPNNAGYTPRLWSLRNCYYRCATYAPAVITAGEDETKELRIQGTFFDKVTKLSLIWRSSDLGHTDLLEDAFSMALEARNSVYDDRRGSLVWRTICHNSRRPSNDDTNIIEEDRRIIEEASRELRTMHYYMRAADDRYDPIKWHSYFKQLVGRLIPVLGNRLCITSQGYFGIVPPYSQEGDQIWAFSGAPNPFLLRASKESSKGMKKYELVGVCYLHGIMNGELEHMQLEPTVIGLF